MLMHSTTQIRFWVCEREALKGQCTRWFRRLYEIHCEDRRSLTAEAMGGLTTESLQMKGEKSGLQCLRFIFYLF